MPVEGEKDIKNKKGGIKRRNKTEKAVGKHCSCFFLLQYSNCDCDKIENKKVVFKQNEDHLSAAPLVQEVTAPTVDLHLFDWVQILTPDSLHGATFTITWACDAL